MPKNPKNRWKYSGIYECPLYGDVRVIEIPYKNEYLPKINQDYVFKVNGLHRLKKEDVEWKEKCFYFKSK